MAGFPITAADVQGHLGVGGGQPGHQAGQDAAAAAASAWVADKVLGLSPDDPATWPDTVNAALHLGCVLLAARWYGRRSSANGVASFAEFGVAYVSRTDPDVANLLGLNRPQVG
jgi:hypothetical protein